MPAVVLLAGTETVEATCWRGRPGPACNNFWLTEFGIGWRLDDVSDPVRADEAFSYYAAYDAGPMFNVGEQLAVGGTLSLKTLGEGYIGVHGRLRWWLDDDWALDFSPGVFIWGGSNDERYELEFPALSARVMLSYGDWVGISVGLDQVRVEGSGSDVDLYGGVYLGSYPGAAVGLVFALVAILYASSAGITGIH